MRIDQINRVNQVYNTSAAKKTDLVTKSKSQDSLAISQTGRDMQIAKQAVANSADIRMDRVADVKLKLDSGIYDVNTKEFASVLVSKIFEATTK